MNTNKTIVIGSIIIILLIIGIPTTYKVIKNHQNNLLKSTESKIVEAAKKCYFEEKCTEEKIYLKDLYTLEYLEKISNPITKEYYNEDSYVERKENIFKFVEEK